MDPRWRAELLATLSPEGRATYEVLRAQLARDVDRCFAASKARLEKGVEAVFVDLRQKCSRVHGSDDTERANEIVASTTTELALSMPAGSHVFPDPKHSPNLASSPSSMTTTARPLCVSRSGITTAGSSFNPAPAAVATGISMSSAAAVAPASGGVPSLIASATTHLMSPADTGAAPYANPLLSTGPNSVLASTMQSEVDHVLETPVTCSMLGLYSVANAIQVNKVPLPELVVSPERSAAFSSSTSITVVSASNDLELALATPTMCSTECPGEGNNATRATPTPTAAPLESLTSAILATCEVSTEASSMALMDVSISAPRPTEVTTTEMLHPLLDITLGKLAPAKCSIEFSEVGTHTMMLRDSQSSALSLTMSIPNAQMDLAYKLLNGRPWHVDIDNDSKLDKTVLCGNVPVADLTTLNTNSSDLGQELRPLPWPSPVHSQKGEQLDDDYSQEAWLGYCLTENFVTKFGDSQLLQLFIDHGLHTLLPTKCLTIGTHSPLLLLTPFVLDTIDIEMTEQHNIYKDSGIFFQKVDISLIQHDIIVCEFLSSQAHLFLSCEVTQNAAPIVCLPILQWDEHDQSGVFLIACRTVFPCILIHQVTSIGSLAIDKLQRGVPAALHDKKPWPCWEAYFYGHSLKYSCQYGSMTGIIQYKNRTELYIGIIPSDNFQLVIACLFLLVCSAVSNKSHGFTPTKAGKLNSVLYGFEQFQWKIAWSLCYDFSIIYNISMRFLCECSAAVIWGNFFEKHVEFSDDTEPNTLAAYLESNSVARYFKSASLWFVL